MTKLILVNRTTEGLRDALFDELDALRNGLIDPGRIRAVTRLAHQILTSARLELDARDIVNDPDRKPPTPLTLGAPASGA